MMIADVIRQAQTEQEIFQLLNAYIEAGGGGGKPSYLLEDGATLPSCANDVIVRSLEIMGKLDAASKQWDDKACLALREALHVFSNALNRLKSIEHEKHHRLLADAAVHGMRGAVSNAGYPPAA